MSERDKPTAVKLEELIGWKLNTVTVAAGMRMFSWRLPADFGLQGAPEMALHLQCPWRLEVSGRIYTGYSDLYYSAEIELAGTDDWDPNCGGSIQDTLLRRLLQCENSPDGITNRSSDLQCLAVERGRCGGFELMMTGDCVLAVFPASGVTESWRLFCPHEKRDHLVFPEPTGVPNEFGF